MGDILTIEEAMINPDMFYPLVSHNSYGNAEAKDQKFPKDAIQGLAKEFADLFSEYLESPWSFWANSFLTCLGSLFADRFTLESQLRPQPRLYTVLLGESADDRKSECIRQTVNFFSETFPEYPICRGAGSAEGLAEWLRSYCPSLLVYDEFKTFASKAKTGPSALLSCVNTLFEENRYQNCTKGHSIQIDSAYLSILAASTIQTFERMWTPSFMDIGFINRLWLVPGRAHRRLSIPLSIPEREKAGLRAILSFMFKHVSEFVPPISLPITPEAHEIFSDWYARTSGSIFTKRLDTYGHRLMILFCINEGKSEVTPDVAKRVVGLLEWQQGVREEYDPIDAEGKIAKLEQLIRKALAKGQLAKRTLQRQLHYERFGLSAWNTAIKNLEDAGEIVYDAKNKLYERKKGDL
jgi:hypothetical protein